MSGSFRRAAAQFVTFLSFSISIPYLKLFSGVRGIVQYCHSKIILIGCASMRIRTVNSFSKYKNRQGELCPTPFISLNGKWVAHLGFSPGHKFKIYGKTGFIVVKLIKPE